MMMPKPLTEALLSRLAVFPLPSTVLFPGTVLPLHVIERRYVDMIANVIRNDEGIAIAMLAPDADPSAPCAPVYGIACAGRIVHYERLPGLAYNVLIHGLDRVRLVEELPLDGGFRRFAAQRVWTTNTGQAGPELARLQSFVVSLRNSVARTDQQLVEVLRATADPIELADILSAVLVNDPLTRQKLLATPDLRARLRALIDSVAEVMIRIGEPPAAARMN